MSFSNAKRLLQRRVVTEALDEAGVDDEIIKSVEHAFDVDDTIQMLGQALLGGADQKQVKNYIKVEMVGMHPPFERTYIELIRPGGKTSHELRELLRDRLTHIRRLLDKGKPDDFRNQNMIQGIDETLAAEAP